MSETAPDQHPEPAALLEHYRALPKGATPAQWFSLTTAIAEIAPWRILMWGCNGEALKIDDSDTPEEVLNERAWRNMIGVMESLAAARTVQRAMERHPAH